LKIILLFFSLIEGVFSELFLAGERLPLFYSCDILILSGACQGDKIDLVAFNRFV